MNTAEAAPSSNPYPLRRLWGTPVAFGFFFLVLAVLSMVGLTLPASLLLIGLLLPLAAYSVTLAASLPLLWGDHTSPWRSALSLRRPPKRRHYLQGVATGAFLFLALQLVANLLKALGVDMASSRTSEHLAASSGPVRWVVLLLLTPLVVPLFEEVFFRGFLYNSLRHSSLGRRWGHWAGLIFSTLCFSFMHFQGASSFMDFFVIAWTGVVGATHCYLLRRSESIAVPFLSHAVYNGVTVAFSVLAAAGAP